MPISVVWLCWSFFRWVVQIKLFNESVSYCKRNGRKLPLKGIQGRLLVRTSVSKESENHFWFGCQKRLRLFAILTKRPARSTNLLSDSEPMMSKTWKHQNDPERQLLCSAPRPKPLNVENLKLHLPDASFIRLIELGRRYCREFRSRTRAYITIFIFLFFKMVWFR